MIETVVFVPTRSNEGMPYRRSFWRTLEETLIGDFGAFSRLSNVRGVWIDLPEQRGPEAAIPVTYQDTSRQYVVALTSWSQFPRWLRTVNWILVETGQKALYVKVAGIPDVLRLPTDAEQ
jgi:hypothetical protein